MSVCVAVGGGGGGVRKQKRMGKAHNNPSQWRAIDLISQHFNLQLNILLTLCKKKCQVEINNKHNILRTFEFCMVININAACDSQRK